MSACTVSYCCLSPPGQGSMSSARTVGSSGTTKFTDSRISPASTAATTEDAAREHMSSEDDGSDAMPEEEEEEEEGGC